MDKNRFSGKPG